MAEWLEPRGQGPWQALAAYAARPAGDLEALGALMQQSGDPDARLCWLPAGEVRETPASSHPSHPSEQSGPALLAADLAGGRLELRGRLLDPALAACFALAVRDLAAGGAPRSAAEAPAPLLAAEPAARRTAARPAATSLIGSSPGMRAAVA